MLERMKLRRLRVDVSFLLWLGLNATGASAQVIPTTFQFSFSNPGARSLGFGGAFVALADDATAAFANPAGLVQLSRPEISLEGRVWGYATPFTEGGRISGRPTSIGLDNTAGLRTGISSETVADVSFVSFVYPKSEWAFAVHRHQLANFESRSENQGFFGEPAPGQEASQRFDDRRSITRLEMVSYGFTAARRFGESVSVGAGVSYVLGNFDREVGLFPPSEATLPNGLLSRNTYDPGGREGSTFLRIDGSDVTFNAGFLWQIAQRFSLGGFYRRGPAFEFEVEFVTGPALVDDFPDGTTLVSDRSPIGFPDVWGLGAAYRSDNEALTLSFEWDRVRNATIVESLRSAAEEGRSDLEPSDFDGLELDDGNELHIGAEYVFLQAEPVLAFRLGAWWDPDHRIRFVGEDALSRAELPRGSDEWHFAFGGGMALKRFQIDFGIDISEFVDIASVSLIYSF